MFRVEIEGLCRKSVAPRFASFEDAKRCYDAAIEFIYRTHPDEAIEVWLLNDEEDYPVLWSIVERDMSKDR